jgi:group I intron endonuclease
MKSYVYIYLDPRKKGVFCYDGLDFSFLYEPFYVGKGTGGRCYSHLREALKTSNSNYKLNKIRKLSSLSKKPIIVKLYNNIEEVNALKIESLLIEKIGRIDKGLGPLTNLTDGGEGTMGYVFSDDQLEKRRLKIMGELNPNYGNKWDENKKEEFGSMRKGHANPFFGKSHSEEWKQKLREDNPGGKATSKPILQKDLNGFVIKRWPSGSKAAKELGFGKGNICSCAKLGKKYKGFYWSYA